MNNNNVNNSNIYGNCNQEIFGMINNLMGQNGMGNFFNGQFSSQMGFDQNINNIFSQFGNMGQGFTNFTSNEQNEYNENNNDDIQENTQGENSENEEDETEQELQMKYIELRNSIINQLPRFKYSYYKNVNKEKEITE